MIKLVIFDLWNTLIPATINFKHLEKIVKDLEMGFSEFISNYEEAVQKKEYLDYEELRKDFFEHFKGKDKELLEKALNEIYFNRFDKIKFYPEVKKTLEKINKNYSTSLLSNAENLHSKEIIKILKLNEKLDYLGWSFEFKEIKPNKIVFEKILKEFNVRKEEAIMVGDSLKSDVFGANNAGIKSCWINRQNKKNNTQIIPTYTINSLDELIKILEEIK
jgi:2-haloalkanoic acid dehalogenase type II